MLLPFLLGKMTWQHYQSSCKCLRPQVKGGYKLHNYGVHCDLTIVTVALQLKINTTHSTTDGEYMY